MLGNTEAPGRLAGDHGGIEAPHSVDQIETDRVCWVALILGSAATMVDP